MVTPAKQQMPHVAAGGNEANFHALVTSPTAKSRAMLSEFLVLLKSRTIAKDWGSSYVEDLIAAIDDFLR